MTVRKNRRAGARKTAPPESNRIHFRLFPMGPSLSSGRPNFAADEAPESVKRVLRDTFDTPICEIELDAGGNEVRRKIVAREGANSYIDQGFMANALLLQPPFYPGTRQWHSPRAIPVGEGGLAEGRLQYTKTTEREDDVTVAVSGELTAERTTQRKSDIEIHNARYICQGEQVYDVSKKLWKSGKLVFTVSCEMKKADGTPVGMSKGTMTLVLRELN